MPTVALHTLGCKVNQYETDRIADQFLSRGFRLVDFSQSADVYVINSCTVTHTADGKSRQAVRAAARRNPGAFVVLTGCYAETSPDTAAAVDGVSLVVGNDDKARLADLVMGRCGIDSPTPTERPEPSAYRRPGQRTRAVVKAQDGCDQFCAYCAIPYARPRRMSRPLDEIVAEADTLARAGFCEIVLAGIRLGTYDDDRRDLVELMRRLVDVPGIERVRLSSIELTDIPEGLIELMAHDRRVCRHLHIPLQSGDDRTLSRMRRPYGTNDFARFVDRAREAVDGLAVTTDIMVGFPGETPEEFESSYRFAERIDFSRMHVFRFSARSGTAAAEMSGMVSEQDKELRSARLSHLGRLCAARFAEGLVGRTVAVLVEGKPDACGRPTGHTDNYVTAGFTSGAPGVGEIAPMMVEEASDGLIYGRAVGSDLSQGAGGDDGELHILQDRGA